MIEKGYLIMAAIFSHPSFIKLLILQTY